MSNGNHGFVPSRDGRRPPGRLAATTGAPGMIAALGCAAIAVGVLVASGTSPSSGSPAGPPHVAAVSAAGERGESGRPTRRVAVVGDSLVAFAEEEPVPPGDTPGRRFSALAAAAGWQATIRGVPGATSHDLLPLLAQAAVGADAVIVSAGSNEAAGLAHGEISRAAVAGWIGDALDALAPVPCVIWSTVVTAPNFYWGDPAAPRAVNRLLAAEAARHPNVHLVDWAASLDHHPGWFLPDGLHHSPEGSAAFVEQLGGAAAVCLTGASPARRAAP